MALIERYEVRMGPELVRIIAYYCILRISI
jgi:hypothetical protein